MRYIGLLGSRRKTVLIAEMLRDEGVPEESLARLSSPIGLDIGACTPEETAVSIAAEIVAHRWGGTGRPLTGTAGPIHTHPTAVDPAEFNHRISARVSKRGPLVCA